MLYNIYPLKGQKAPSFMNVNVVPDPAKDKTVYKNTTKF